MVDTLGTEEIELLRSEVNGWLPDTCDIYRLATVDDSAGGETESENVLASGVKCDIQSGAASEQERVIADRIRSRQIFTVTLPANTEVKLEDHILVTSRGDLHLRVQAVIAPESWELERRVITSVEGEHLA